MAIPSDLRSTIALLEESGQLVRVKKEVNLRFELSAICSKLGVGNPNTPPAKNGPAVLFEKVKGYSIPVLEGVYGSRERVALLLGCPKEKVPFQLLEAMKKRVTPTLVSNAPCQEVVIDKDVDLMKILPIPVMTETDGNLMINLGLTRVGSVNSGVADVTFHRICVQGPDTMTILLLPGKHIGELYAAAEAKGQPLPVSVSIGFDPATAITASSHRTITPIGFDELSVAGGLLGSPIEVVKCKTVDAEALARAEIVLEGEIMPKERLREDSYSRSGNSMADFAGHHGTTGMGMPVVKVRAITHRQNPIFQTIITPGEEVNNLLGVPAEAGVLQIAQVAAPGNVVNAYAPPSGGGKLVVVVQVVKKSPLDDGVARQVALVTLSSLNEIKHVVLVDEDVDIFDPVDVFWAMTTRFQANTSLVPIPGVDGHQLDPSWRLQPAPRAGLHCKAIFDCTIPYELKRHFRRPKYLDVDVNEYVTPT